MDERRNPGKDSREVLLRLTGISKSFGPVVAVEPLDLEIYSGDFFAILGPSGCGKTTLLRIIGGFLQPTSGTIRIEDRDVTALGPERRPTNMVFQGYGLFPHMTVRQNIAYGLRIAKVPAEEAKRRIDEIISLVRLDQLSDRFATTLSGGQQQRVALARALVMRPPILLLDEPLAALDLKLRQSMQEELRRIHSQIGGTFLFVTHDQGEAMSLANRIAVMRDGKLLQVDSPENVYRRPHSLFVATFVGEANVFAGKRRNGLVTLECGGEFHNSGPDGNVDVVVRPEAIEMTLRAASDIRRLTGTLIESVFLGSLVRHVVRLKGGKTIQIQEAGDRPRAGIGIGAEVELSWPADKQSVLPA
jgi:ABC-type Fe3+/spermidine/putrescine transport system ATPase subunit